MKRKRPGSEQLSLLTTTQTHDVPDEAREQLVEALIELLQAVGQPEQEINDVEADE